MQLESLTRKSRHGLGKFRYVRIREWASGAGKGLLGGAGVGEWRLDAKAAFPAAALRSSLFRRGKGEAADSGEREGCGTEVAKERLRESHGW